MCQFGLSERTIWVTASTPTHSRPTESSARPNKYGPSKWPANNMFPANPAAVQFVNYNNGNGGDYHLLSSSPYKNAGSDGKDLGADIDTILADTDGVE